MGNSSENCAANRQGLRGPAGDMELRARANE